MQCPCATIFSVLLNLAIGNESCTLSVMRNPKFLGVYSLRKDLAGGHRHRFFIWQLPDGSYAIQQLDSALTQTGPAKGIPAPAFDQAFVAEPSILAAPVTTPDFRGLIAPPPQRPKADDTVASLDRARHIKQVEADLRETFQKAMRALSRPRDRKGAIAALERVANTQEDIEPAHKYMFRDFGVSLRKKALYELALTCARKVVALSPQDDHARFNLARILTILGRYDEAIKQVEAAIKLDPAEEIYPRLARHIERERAFAEEMTADDFTDGKAAQHGA